MREHRIALAALVRGGAVLLCHRRPDRDWFPDVWDLVGGHLEVGETPREAIVRECREELGIEVRSLREWPIPIEAPEVEAWGFVVSAWAGEPVNLAPEEHDAIGWFTSDLLIGLDLADDTYLAALTDLLSGPAPGQRH